MGDFRRETRYAFFAVRDPREQNPDKSNDIPVLFRPLYGESTLIKILPQTKARTISHYLLLGQSVVIIYSQAVHTSGSKKLIKHQANARYDKYHPRIFITPWQVSPYNVCNFSVSIIRHSYRRRFLGKDSIPF